MKKKILLGLIVFVSALIVLAPVLYFIHQKTQESKMTGPNPAEEYQKFANDKTITRTYSGVLPCDNCDGIDSVLSISQESESVMEGTFTISETYLGGTKDLSVSSGTWSIEEGVFILVFSDGSEKKFERVDSEKIVEIDKDNKRLQENGKDLVLTLLN